LISISGMHIRAARALLGWTQEELSRKAKVGLGTVKRMEGYEGPVEARTDTVRKVTGVMERAGVDFLDDGQPGVRMRAKK
jgi:predicted transcriptional regulator